MQPWQSYTDQMIEDKYHLRQVLGEGEVRVRLCRGGVSAGQAVAPGGGEADSPASAPLTRPAGG